jgi:uncharacterized membrane protein YphA (DoxX/SURF4 family)
MVAAWIPARSALAYIFGAVLTMAAVLIVFGKRPRLVATLLGLFLLVLVVFIQIPFNAVNNLLVIGGWTRAFKEFAFVGSAFVVAGSLPLERHNTEANSVIGRLEGRLLLFAKYPLAIMVAVFGLDHFLYTGYVASLVPAWIPGHVFWTYFAGAALIAAGVGIIFNIKARLAATLLGVMLFIWVLILHIPRAIADPSGLMGNEWTSVCEALAYSGVAFIMGKTLPTK